MKNLNLKPWTNKKMREKRTVLVWLIAQTASQHAAKLFPTGSFLSPRGGGSADTHPRGEFWGGGPGGRKNRGYKEKIKPFHVFPGREKIKPFHIFPGSGGGGLIAAPYRFGPSRNGPGPGTPRSGGATAVAPRRLRTTHRGPNQGALDRGTRNYPRVPLSHYLRAISEAIVFSFMVLVEIDRLHKPIRENV